MTRLTPGTTSQGIPGRTWNRLVDMLERPPEGVQPPPLDAFEYRGGQLVMEVEAQTDVGELGVLELTEPVFLPTPTTGGGNDDADEATLAAPAMRADAPTNATSRVAITLEPIENGNRGQAVVLGLAWARVDVVTAGDTSCHPVASDIAALQSGSGAIDILWRELDGEVTETGEQWCLVMLGGTGGGGVVAFCQATDNCRLVDISVPVSIEPTQLIAGESGPADGSRVANTANWTVVSGEYLVAVKGDYPRWQPNTGYGSGDIVTYDNGGGLRRWSRDSSGTSGETFDAGEWTDEEAANGWRIGHVPHAIATGTAGAASNSGNGYTAISVTLDADTPNITLGCTNPGKVTVASADKVVVWVWGETVGGTLEGIIVNAESHGGGGGGGGDGDELVAAASGQTAGYLEAVLVDHPGGLSAPEYGVDFTRVGGTMHGKVTVPPASNNRLVVGVATADVKHSDATFTLGTTRGLADGDDPGGSIIVHAPIASYRAGDACWAIRDATSPRWMDATPARRTIIKAQTTGAVSAGADGWTVNNVQVHAGGRNPGATAVGNAALRSYLNNEWVYLLFNDEAERWEDFTPKQFRVVSYLTRGAVAEGASSFSVDNVTALAGGALPVGSTADDVTLQVYGAVKDYVEDEKGYAIWNEAAAQWQDFTPPGSPVVTFDFLVAYGQSLTAGAWNDGTRKWTDGAGTVTLLTDNGDGTYDEAGTQAVKWAPNFSVSPASGKAYRGWGIIKDGVYKAKGVYTCEGVDWTSGE